MPLRLGTRGSPLALVQARMVQAHLARALGRAADSIDIHVFKTTGDKIQDRPLADFGGKGLFTKEIEDALLAGAIDAAVHSAKDLPTFLPDGLMLAACLEREDPRDVFVSSKASSIDALPRGAVVGSASPRRQAIIACRRPDLSFVTLRGNVETRLRKLDAGDCDATILALAGMKRLGLDSRATTVMAVEDFLPAVGQGAIALETRANDETTRALLAAINHGDTLDAVRAERAMLAALEGSCRTPIGGHAVIAGGILTLRGLLAKPDGSASHGDEMSGDVREAERIGARLGRVLKERAGPGFF